tara:strand:- start:1108 stop:2007 length:900 start_codon:yes stop_codon:yes gene_type:complete
MEIDEFVKNNIHRINTKISSFKGKDENEYNDVMIKEYLQKKLTQDIQNESIKKSLIEELEKNNYVKSKILDIANKFILYKPHLTDYFEAYVYDNIFSREVPQDLADDIINKIDFKSENKLETKFVKSNLKKLLTKSIYIASKGGFTSNLQKANTGLRIANEGDAAQFFFIARAILAGFNCSNVDVRSSRYDAIVDFNSKLIKIQVKGISQGNRISFFDRARGGQGIDHTHERNVGKRITSKDCDIYVAVDKQVGTCYLIPMTYADKLDDETAKKGISIDKVNEYLENWDSIISVSKQLS